MRLTGRIRPLPLHIGAGLSRGGRYEEAIAAAKRAFTRNPNLSFAADTHDLLAWSYSGVRSGEGGAGCRGRALEALPLLSLEVIMLKSPYKDPTITERRVAALPKRGCRGAGPPTSEKALGHVGSGLEYLLRLYGRRAMRRPGAALRKPWRWTRSMPRPMPSWVGLTCTNGSFNGVRTSVSGAGV